MGFVCCFRVAKVKLLESVHWSSQWRIHRSRAWPMQVAVTRLHVSRKLRQNAPHARGQIETNSGLPIQGPCLQNFSFAFQSRDFFCFWDAFIQFYVLKFHAVTAVSCVRGNLWNFSSQQTKPLKKVVPCVWQEIETSHLSTMLTTEAAQEAIRLSISVTHLLVLSIDAQAFSLHKEIFTSRQSSIDSCHTSRIKFPEISTHLILCQTMANGRAVSFIRSSVSR